MNSNAVKKLVTDQIIDELEKGTVTWHKPWFAIGKCNLATRHVYTGTNKLLLARKEDQFYLTFKQCHELGGKIKKDEKAQTVIFWKFGHHKELDDNGDETIVSHAPLVKSYNIFGISQTENIPEDMLEKLTTRAAAQLKKNKLNFPIEDFLSATKADIVHEDLTNASYSTGRDIIDIPEIGQFDDSNRYYSTMLHELSHWTGHKTRCDRDLSGTFGSKSYGKEELVAELGSAMLCHELDIPRIKENAAYVESWLTAIRENPNMLFSSATKAEKAVTFLKKLVL